MLYSIFTQARDTLIRRVARANLERRHEEQQRDTANRRAVRGDDERREQEQVKDLSGIVTTDNTLFCRIALLLLLCMYCNILITRTYAVIVIFNTYSGP